MVKVRDLLFYLLLLMGAGACSVVRQVEDIPADDYLVPADLFSRSGKGEGLPSRRIKATIAWEDSAFHIVPQEEGLPTLHFSYQQTPDFRFYRRTFDIDLLTIPFKVRPSVEGFPEQLNPNFSAALYLGRRIDSYHIKPVTEGKKRKFISGFGGGYGGFVGLGSVTMNPFVTQNAITYEYEGLVLTGGAAGIYDAKKFNLGLAVGSDFLVDKNRASWIYHKKVWFGLLFGLNLN